MKLTDLDPQFVRYETIVEEYDVIDGDPVTWRDRGCPSKKVTAPREYKSPVNTFAEAQGVVFDCPKCSLVDRGRSHLCEATFEDRGVLPNQGTQKPGGQPVRWKIESGTGFHDLTLSPSILLVGGCEWHGHIIKGEVSCV